MIYIKTLLIFVRHGESDGNKSGRFNGNLDLLLTERGRTQAKKTAEYLDRFKLDKVYASDLQRAFETAKIIADRQNLSVIKDKALREIFGGKFEGQIYNELKDKFPEEFDVWLNDLGNCRCPGGESVRELKERFDGRIREIAKSDAGKTILIGTHALPIRVMSTVWYKKDITQIKEFDFVKNASVTVVDYTDLDNPQVLEYNIADHLGELSTELPKDI